MNTGTKDRVNRESYKDRAYRIIREKIISGELRPGDDLDRRTMAASLGMSVAPVLEAMLMLTEEGLLDTRPRAITRVRVPNKEDVRGRHWIREALECQVARLIFGEPVRRDFGKLLPLARAVDEARAANRARWQGESEFHVALASLVGSETFLAMFRKAVGVGLFYEISAIDAAVPRRTASQRSHVALLEALRDAKTADEAEAAIREHLNSGKSALGVK